MDFQTKVEIPTGLPPVAHGQPILLLGSCFAENMGKQLAENKFDVDVNPFGILYNPLSVATALAEIEAGKTYRKENLFASKGLWHSFMHHGSFSAPTAEETLRNINARLQQAHDAFPRLERLMITFGTAYVYERRETGQVVSNCHQLPENRFCRRLLTVDEIVAEYSSRIARLAEKQPKLKLLFTVSPIRHTRDGMHANQLSKATLLLAIDRLCRLFPEQAAYFPSYEIVLDELRDYRFYADDMVHPSPLAVRYLWERFSDACFSADTQQIISEIESIRRDLAHRPFRPEGEAYQRFLGQIVLKIERLTEKYPYLDFQKEKANICSVQQRS